VISGALTDVDWRWIFYINVPVVVFALAMVLRVLPESRMAREGHRIDVAGAVTATEDWSRSYTALPSRRQAKNLTAFQRATGWRHSIIVTNIPPRQHERPGACARRQARDDGVVPERHAGGSHP